jgi:hypothetical protein
VNRDEAQELLATVQSFDNRRVDATVVSLWLELLERYTKDECIDALIQHKAERPDDWVEPGHIVQIVRAKRNDFIARADPDDQPHMVGLDGVKRDRYGFIDKSADDEIEYPHEWTSQQRLQHYWGQIENRRDAAALNADQNDPDVLHMPAHPDVRAACMDHIRSVIAERCYDSKVNAAHSWAAAQHGQAH